MSTTDLKAYLANEDFRMSYIVEYWRHKWERTQDINDYDCYQYHLSRYQQFTAFRKSVLAALDISE